VPPLRVGVISIIRSARECVDLAGRVEAAGFWGLGLADTAPKLYQAVYPTVTASLLATERIMIGPCVSNPVSQHWSVHAATAKALDELAPGRSFVGLSTGDGAVHSVGQKPARWAEVEQAVEAIRQHAPAGTELHVAASGPKGTESAGRVASDLTLGVGLDPATIQRFARRARTARAAAGVAEPLRIWGLTSVHFADTEADVPAVRAEVRSLAYGTARFGFAAGFEDKGIPDEWQPLIRERLGRYDFDFHARGAGDENPNARLFEDHPDVERFLLDRQLVAGTVDQVAERLAGVVRETGVDGLWISIVPTRPDDDPHELLDRAAAVAARLT